MLFRSSPFLLGASLFFAATASAQVTFSTTTYANNNLWSNNGRNGHIWVDLNGDGREDFVSANDASFNSGCAGQFAVTLSQADGTYAAPVCYSLPSGNATYIAAGDWDGDGFIDLVVTNDLGNAWIFLNDRTGQLGINVELNFPAELGGIVAADVDHDGPIDLVYSIPNPSSNTQTIGTVINSKTYGWYLGPTTTFADTEPVCALNVGDFDGDGIVDVETLGCSLVHNHIFYGDNTGHFTAGPSFGTNNAYASADPNSDGILSVVGILAPGNILDLEYGHYNRTLTSQHISLKSCATALPVFADFDGDGNNDLIVAEDADCKGDGPFTLNFMKSSGGLTPTFGPEQVIYSTPDTIFEVDVLRASHSNKPDLTVWQAQLVQNTITNPEQLVLLNTTTGSFPGCTPIDYQQGGITYCGAATSWNIPSGPVHFSFAGANVTPGRDLEMWIDSTKVAEQHTNAYSKYAFLDTTQTISPGNHQLTVFSVGWDYSLLVTGHPLYVGATSCPAPSYQGFQVCSPTQNSVVTSPVTVTAQANWSGPITRMEIWVDSTKVYSNFGSSTINTQVIVPSGHHQIGVYFVPASGVADELSLSDIWVQ
jgi:hypothetical protein